MQGPRQVACHNRTTSVPPCPARPLPYRTTVIEQLYRVALGPTGAGHYAKCFETFETLGRPRPTWNWAAASCTLGWMAYRKLWRSAALYAAAVPGLVLLWLTVLRSLLAPPLPIEIGLGLMMLIFSCAIPGLWGDTLVYNDVHRRTMRALELAPTLDQARTQLEQQAPNKRHQFLIVAAYIAVAALVLAAAFARPKAPVQVVMPVEHQGLEAAQESVPVPPASESVVPVVPASAPTTTASDITSHVNAAGTTSEPRVLTAQAKITATEPPPEIPPEMLTEPASAPTPQADPIDPEPNAIPVPDVAAPTIAPPTTATATTAALAAGAVTTAAVVASKAQGRTKKEKEKEKQKEKAKEKEKTKEKAQEKEREKTKNKENAKLKESKESKESTKKETKPLTKAQARAQEKAKAKEKAKEKAQEKAKAQADAKAAALAKAKTAPAPVQTTLQAQLYYINVGTFSNAANAKQMQQRLQRAGMPVVVQSSTTNKGERVRVRTGPFDKDESERNAQRLRSMGLEAVIFQTR